MVSPGALAAAIVLAPPSVAQDGEAWSFDVIARLQLDASAADADLSGFSDRWTDAEVRRARLGLDAERGPLSARLELDIVVEDGELGVEDLWVRREWGAAALTLGHQKPPVTLEHQVSARFILPLERASFIEAFGFDRRVGATVGLTGERYTLEAGLYAGNLMGDADAAAEGSAIAARAAFNPVVREGLTVHLGASAQHRQAADEDPIDYAARPRIHLSDSFVDTDAFADEDLFLGLEAGVIAGRIHLIGELGGLAAEGASGGDADLSGGYLEAGFFLTPGDSLGYEEGVLDSVEPARPVGQGGLGAWQLRARFDSLDLTDGAVAGGEQTSWSIGLNWYATERARVLAEINRADIDDGPEGSGEVESAAVRFSVYR